MRSYNYARSLVGIQETQGLCNVQLIGTCSVLMLVINIYISIECTQYKCALNVNQKKDVKKYI